MAQAGNYFCITNSYQLLIAQKPKFSTLQPCLTMNMTWDGLIRLSLSTLLLGHWYEIMALYYVKSILTEISASRQDRRVLQKSKIIRIEFLSKWGMLQTSRYV